MPTACMTDSSRFKPLRSRLSLAAHWWQHRLAIPALLLVALALGFLSWRFNVMSDHTNNHRNTLSAASIQVLHALPGRIEITAFCSNSPYKGRYFRKSIEALLQRYQHQHTDIHLQFIDPANAPTLAREQQIKKEGEMIIRYRGQQVHMYLPYTEEAFTNLLLQLQHGERAPLLFAGSNGEPSLDNTTDTGASQLATAIRSAGLHAYTAASLEPAPGTNEKLPTLVLGGASTPYSDTQVHAIQAHISKGGSLIWLVDSAEKQGLQSLAQTLGLEISQGIAIDPANRQYDIALHALGTQRYSGQGPTEDFVLRTFFNTAHAIVRYRQPNDTWQTMPLVAAAEQGWVSASYRSNQPDKLPAFNPQTDTQGPATVALALEKKFETGEWQRVLVISSTSFFTNVQLQKGGNLALSLRSLQWVVNNQPTVTLPVAPLRDSVILLPSQPAWLMLLFNGFQFGLPALLLIAGWWTWRRKYRH